MIIKTSVMIQKRDKANFCKLEKRPVILGASQVLGRRTNMHSGAVTTPSPWLSCSSWLLINPSSTSSLSLFFFQLRHHALPQVSLHSLSSELRNGPQFIVLLTCNQWEKVTLEIGGHAVEWESSARETKSYVQVYPRVCPYHHMSFVVPKLHSWNAFQISSKLQ